MPTKYDLCFALPIILIGFLILRFLPGFEAVGWSAIIYAIFYSLFPGPLARAKLQRTERKNEEFRESIEATGGGKFEWWKSPIPFRLVLVVSVVYAIAT